MVHSHWSRSNEARLSLVESFIVLLRQHSYAIKNQQGASKKPLVGGFGCDELVLYGIRVLVEQLLGTVLDIEVDHTASHS